MIKHSPSPYPLPRQPREQARLRGGQAQGERAKATPSQAPESFQLETFPNPNPERDYVIECTSAEFTCLCPRTGQPDFATIAVRYTADKLCFELKSFKLYLWSYRNEGAFHEAVTNKILNDLVATTKPRWMEVKAIFNIRGGITTTITASYQQPR